MVRDEKGSCRVCIQVLHLSTSESRETKAFWTSAALTHPRMEIGAHYNGFVFKLPPTIQRRDDIWVVVDRLTKSA